MSAGGRAAGLLAAAVFFLLAYLLPLGARPLFVPDEYRLAEIAREMLASGDWIVPRLDGVRYFEKPVLAYWVSAPSLALFGTSALAARLPAALAVLVVAWILHRLTRRAGAEVVRPGWAPLVFAGSALVFVTGTTALIDPILAAALAAALALVYRWGTEPDPSRSRRYLAAAGAACGLAFLTKGFLAFAVPAVVIVPFALVRRRFLELLRSAWIPIGAALVVALPWSVAIHLREPDFWRYFFWIEHVKRFFAEGAQHDEPPWFFVPILLGGALPWTFQLPAIAAGLRRAGLRSSLVLFAWLWLALPFLFFSASRGKLPTYVLPCMAPAALLVAIGLTRYFEGDARRAFDRAALVCAVLVALGGLALVALEVADLGARPWGPGESGAWLSVLGALGLWAVCALLAARAREPGSKMLLFAAGPLFLMALVPLVVPQRVLERKAPGPLLAAERARAVPETVLVADERSVHAVCWAFERDDVYLLQGKGELAYGLDQPDAAGRCLDADAFARLRAEHAGRPVLLFYKDTESDAFASLGLEPVRRASMGSFVVLELR